jgi:hypothetical protein
MITLTNSNYFSAEAAHDYWSVSLFKEFDKCEANGLAIANGEYQREQTSALLVGSYVDVCLTGDEGAPGRFSLQHPEIFNSRTGALKAEFKHADTMIEAVKAQPLMVDYLKGEHQVIMTAELFDVPWKIKIDVHGGNRIIDLKTVKDFEPLYKEGFGRISWIEYWGYDIQGAIYQRIEQIASGRTEPLPFYIVAVTKEKVPDVAVIQIPQYVLDTALKVVESKIDRFDLVKHGYIEPIRCERCDYCKKSKRLTEPSVFEIENI